MCRRGKKDSGSPAWGLGLALVIVALAVGPVGAEDRATETITGPVKKAEVDRGKILSVYIEDAERGKVLVPRGMDKSKELLQLVGSTVRATGYVKKSRTYDYIPHAIDILAYEVVPPANPDAQTESP